MRDSGRGGADRSARLPAACAGLAAVTAATIVLGAAPAHAADRDAATTNGQSGGIGFGRIPGFRPVPPNDTMSFTGGATTDVDVPITAGQAAGRSVTVPTQPLTGSVASDADGSGIPVSVTVGAVQGRADDPLTIDAVPSTARTAEPTGTPGAVAIHAWTTRAYPAMAGALAGMPITVTAIDRNGAALPIHGDAVVMSGGRSRTSAFDSTTGTATFIADSAGLPLGDATIAIAVSGAASTAPVARTVSATLIPAAIQAASARLPYTTVYPVADGYRDGLTITLQSKTSTGTPIAAHGWARITRGTTTVAKWKLTSSSEVLHWSGRVQSALKPGRYQLHLTVAGPQGRTSTVTRNLTVSPKRLTEHTRIAGFSVIGEHGTEKFHDVVAQHGKLHCITSPTALVCQSTADLKGAASRITLPPVQLSEDALAAEAYGPLEVRFITTVFSVVGTPRWIPAGVRSDPVLGGRVVYKWLTLPKGAFEIPITLQLGPNGRVALVGAELQYRYTTLD